MEKKKQRLRAMVHCIVLNKEGDFLILKRIDNDEDSPGAWEFPAGKLEFGENPEFGARRELEEETGIKSERLDFLDIISYTYEKKDRKIHLIRFFYKLITDKKEITLNEKEHENFRWVPKEEIQKYDFPDYVIKLLKKIN